MDTSLDREKKQRKADKKIKKLFNAGKSKYFTPFDLLIYALLLVLVILSTVFIFFLPKAKGNSFEVYYNNQKIATYTLTKDAEYIFYIDEDSNCAQIKQFDGGIYKEYNKITVKDGKVAITETDCKDKSCQVRGAIDFGELICLPHRLKIAVVNLQTDIDFIT